MESALFFLEISYGFSNLGDRRSRGFSATKAYVAIRCRARNNPGDNVAAHFQDPSGGTYGRRNGKGREAFK